MGLGADDYKKIKNNLQQYQALFCFMIHQKRLQLLENFARFVQRICCINISHNSFPSSMLIYYLHIENIDKAMMCICIKWSEKQPLSMQISDLRTVFSHFHFFFNFGFSVIIEIKIWFGSKLIRQRILINFGFD